MHPLDPDMIRFNANREFAKLYEIFGVCWTVAGTMINLGLCLLPLFIEPLYHLWTRGKLPFNFPLFALLALSVAIRTLGHPALSFLQAINDIAAQTRISIIRAALVVSLTFAFIYHYGLLGVGAALAVSELLGAATLPFVYTLRIFAATDVPFPIRRLIVAVGSVAVVGATDTACCAFPSLRGVVCAAAAVAIIVLAGVQLAMLNEETRRRLFSLLPLSRWRGRQPRSQATVTEEPILR